MSVNGRQKGSTYERAIAKHFAKWSNSDVKRVPLSGGWAKEAKFDVKNDLVSTDKYFPVGVECKKQEKWKMEDLLVNKKSKVFDWWEQVNEECVKWRFPLLVFTRNFCADFVMIDTEDFKSISGLHEPTGRYFMVKTKRTGKVFVFTLKTFLKIVDYEHARGVCKARKKRIKR